MGAWLSDNRRLDRRAVGAEGQLAVVVPSRHLGHRASHADAHDHRVIAEPFDLIGRAGRCSSSLSVTRISLRNNNGAFVQTRTSRTQRPYPRTHLG
jgi:hypothetical protein